MVSTVIRLVLPDGDIQDVAVAEITPEVSVWVLIPVRESVPRIERVTLRCDTEASAGGKLVYL